MAECIEREKVLSEIKSRFIDLISSDGDLYVNEGINRGLNKAIGIVENAPAADVRPERRGRWERFRCKGDRHDTFRCSDCGHLLWYVTKFCPNCGAKMGGKGGKSNV
ncbi:MAG: hypothetical protein HDT43_00890 [Ruminococcaceae bacterium]|nr:hypothetical protein [Oscillospiraceae bacterium]